MPAVSNNNGRSLEYLIVAALAKDQALQLTPRGVSAQSRDKEHAVRLDNKLRDSFSTSAEIISKWALELRGKRPATLDRTNDSDDGVADIIISSAGLSINLSIKHNSDSLSHPRPYSFAQKCGHEKGSKLDLDHRHRMAKISDKFREKAGRATNYVDVPKAKQVLYVDTCKEIEKTINLAGKHQDVAKVLFDSIMGSNFQKIIVETDRATKNLKKISVHDYSQIIQAKELRTSIFESQDSCRVEIEFDNSWSLSLRIHTAASRISSTGQLSLKFDATTRTSVLPEPRLLYP